MRSHANHSQVGVSKNRKTISADPVQTSPEAGAMFSDFYGHIRVDMMQRAPTNLGGRLVVGVGSS